MNQTITVIGERYRTMFVNFPFPGLNDLEWQKMWFKQGGKTTHTARADAFLSRSISRFGDLN